MPRANRHFRPGFVWHLTHRCHRQQFLLKFARDRQACEEWLFQARRRFDLCVLNYTVTCNHIHLLVLDRGRGEIAPSLQLIAGCTAQQFNRRKQRRGAYWEDRYHATAVETGAHLARCLTYIDLNMVRAGVVAHPRDWPHGGYHEIREQRLRKRIIDRVALAELLELSSVADLAEVHNEWIARGLQAETQRREPKWSEALAVGGRSFTEQVRRGLGVTARQRAIDTDGDDFILRDPPACFGLRNGAIWAKFQRRSGRNCRKYSPLEWSDPGVRARSGLSSHGRGRRTLPRFSSSVPIKSPTAPSPGRTATLSVLNPSTWAITSGFGRSSSKTSPPTRTNRPAR